jgi:3-(3-hydroxy-phenyl)propionate hydroxylase
VLDALGARLAAVNTSAADRSTLRLQCRDQTFLDWAKRHRLGVVLVRPDRFIAERLAPRAELRSLDAFVNVARAPAIESAISATAA